jgi:glycosyltransferase involved in cell wall biosynthesis
MKKVIVSVTNDLTTDQRVNRTCLALTEMGFDVMLAGRRLPSSLPLSDRAYQTRRLRLLFRKGPHFYAEFNLRLFLFLLFRKCDLLVSNDLDTLLANYLVSRIRRVPLVHDCHEYFRGVPELVGRPRVTGVWKFIEDRIFPKLRHVVAVNGSIAAIYREEYGIPLTVVRNVPFRNGTVLKKDKAELGIPPGERVILYQGAVNMGRGLEEMILAMNHIRTRARLLIIGTGDILDELKQVVRTHELDGRVIFTGQVPFEDLLPYTSMGDIGISIEKDLGVNYQNCLPNKFLDYIQAGLPVLVSPFPEMAKIVNRYGIGRLLESHDPVQLAETIDRLFTDEAELARFRENLVLAASDLCWENEAPVLKQLIHEALTD